jgi:hypothetical protein
VTATPPLFEGRRGVFWWPQKIGEVIGELLEQENNPISPQYDSFTRMMSLIGELLEMLLSCQICEAKN